MHSSSKTEARIKTIVFHINTIRGGGAARVMLQLAYHFSQIGYHSVLVTSFADTEHDYPVPPEITRLSLEARESSYTFLKRNVSRIGKLRKLCKELKPDAVISFMAEPNFRALCATLGLPVKNIISVRNDPNREYAEITRYVLGKFGYLLADGCIFQTEDAKKWFPKAIQRKSAVILNDVKEEFFSIDRKPTKTVVSIGRLSAQKNYSLLIDAYTRIAPKHPEYRLLIYGMGKLHDELQEQIQRLKMENTILFRGHTSNVAEVLSHADVFVLSSDYEGLPNSLMEALAAGVPCISTDCPCGGPKSIIESEKNGILVPPNNLDQLSDAIDRLLSDELLRERLSENAKKSAKLFHPQVVFNQWRNYVENILETS